MYGLFVLCLLCFRGCVILNQAKCVDSGGQWVDKTQTCRNLKKH